MSDTDLLRSSRDGDQFHYHWAARQALRLLRPDTTLTALAIEGVSPDDVTESAGDEVIDIAEYWGSDQLASADKVTYRQLKHSTAEPNKVRTSSFLKTALRGFAKKYRAVLDQEPDAASRIWFEFVSVPPIADAVKTAIDDLAHDRQPAASEPAAYIRQQLQTALESEQVAGFCRRFHIVDGQPGLLHLRTVYASEVAAFLPGAGAAQDVLLREMVSTRASSIAGFDPVITRATVLSTLRVTEEMLLPAPNMIEPPSPIVEVPDIQLVAELLITAKSPVIAHASGGMGKSVLASTIGEHLPAGSIALTYDCFGNGGYRRVSSRRHEHRQALLQLANELAAMGLCDPVIPSDTASPGDYMRTFLNRLQTAQLAVRAQNPDALVVLVIDAADNAVMAAKDTGTSTFVPDLIREALPIGVRLLMLSRTERVHYLEPSPACIEHPLTGFELEHSRAHLESKYEHVSADDASEFHRLTDRNPRVQALTMTGAGTVDAALRSLGELRQDGEVFDQLMKRRIAEIRDDFGADAKKVERLCTALAALRPRIPVEVLAHIAEVEPEFVRSLAAEVGRALLIDHDTVQFRDEPTETWFRTEFRPVGASLTALIDSLRPLAEKYPYLSASLPQLLYEAGQVRELVELAMSDEALAAGNDVERREIAHERAQFALKAALRDRREPDAARLAWRAGELHAGETRRIGLIRANTDLAGEFLDAQTIDALLAKRALMGDWPGSHLHAEGALLAATKTNQALARSRVRSALEWMQQWVREAVARDENHGVDEDDIAELATGILTVESARSCAEFLGRWQPKWLAYTVGRKVARRLVDRNRRQELEELAVAAGHVERLQLAVASVATEAGIDLPPSAVRRTARMLRKHGAPLELGAPHSDSVNPSSVAWPLALAVKHDLLDASEASEVLARYLPHTLPYGAGERHGRDTRGLLFAFALHAHLGGHELDVEAIAPSDVREGRENSWQRTRAVVDYDQNIVPLVPWMDLWVELVLAAPARIEQLVDKYQQLMKATPPSWRDYETPFVLINSVGHIASQLITRLPVTPADREQFETWVKANQRHLSGTTITAIARQCAAVPECHDLALSIAQLRRDSIANARLPAEEKASAYVDLARATYAFDSQESSTDFGRAVDITNQLGEDAYDRWRATTAIARHACDDTDRPAEAYRLAQVAEGLCDHLGDDYLAARALREVGMLSMPTALAVASRWRDRRVADIDQIVTALTDREHDLATRHPLWVLGLLPLGTKDPWQLVERIPDTGERQLAEAVVRDWLGQPSKALTPNPVDADSHETDQPPEETAGAAAIFEHIDLLSPGGWDAALLEVSNRDSWLRRDMLFDHAAAVPAADLRPMLEAIADASHPTTYDYNRLIERLARRNPFPQGARRAVETLVDRLVERFPKSFTTRGFDPIDLELISHLCGRQAIEVIGDALARLGSTPEHLAATECFELASRLAARMSNSDNRTLLQDATNSFREVAPLNHADGPFDSLPANPATIEECVAGLIWAAAGDTAKATRWNTAHTIRMWTMLGCTELLEPLSRYALGAIDLAAFTDKRFVFYQRHALLWTLMAIARAAHESPAPPGALLMEEVLRRVAFDDPPNVVLQHTARSALLRLSDGGHVELTDDEHAHLDAINAPQVIVVRNTYSQRGRTDVELEPATLPDDEAVGAYEEEQDDHSPAADESTDPDEGPPGPWTRLETRFSFFFDFEDHWCGPLGRAFNVDKRRIAELVDEVLVERWRSPFRGKFEDDARHQRKLYGDGGTHAYKTSWPAEDDLDFYLATHALYEVAGYLTKSYPAFGEESATRDEFAEWLQDYIPTRADSRWVADRRDPSPDDIPSVNDEDAGSHASRDAGAWRFEIWRSRFDDILMPDSQWMTLDGYWTTTAYDRSETVHVSSALVEPRTGRSLLNALRTSPGLRSAHLPFASDEGSVPAHFDLRPVVEDLHVPNGFDTEDPSAEGIDWPPPTPTPEIVSALGVTPDADQRIWSHCGSPVLRTAVWSTPGNAVVGSHGHRLQATNDALARLLSTTGRSLIASVEIRRSVHDRYGRDLDRENELEYLHPYVRFFLVHHVGSRLEFTS